VFVSCFEIEENTKLQKYRNPSKSNHSWKQEKHIQKTQNKHTKKTHKSQNKHKQYKNKTKTNTKLSSCKHNKKYKPFLFEKSD
jgi:hypothetical protein